MANDIKPCDGFGQMHIDQTLTGNDFCPLRATDGTGCAVAPVPELWQTVGDIHWTDEFSMTEFSSRRVTMVDTQVRPSDVTKFPIIEAMLATPREAYVPKSKREAAYLGENLQIAPGRVMLEPRTLAKMLDALDIQPTDVVLDVGCGLGYSTAVIARFADAVVAVEQDEALAAEAQSILAAHGVDNAAVIHGALDKGDAKNGPYDVITIQGGVEMVPGGLLDQLKDGGRIACIFIEGALGVVRIGYKSDGRISWRFLFNAGAPVLPGFVSGQAFAL